MKYWKRKLFAALIVATMLPAVAATAAEYKLSNQFPPSHHISKGLAIFADKVKEYSQGRITIRIFDSAQLGICWAEKQYSFGRFPNVGRYIANIFTSADTCACCKYAHSTRNVRTAASKVCSLYRRGNMYI